MTEKHGDSGPNLKEQNLKKQALAAYIGSVDASKLLDISQTTLERLVSDGRITKITQGTYDPVQLVREFVAYKGGIGARSEVEKQKAIKLQRENARATGQLVPMDIHRAAITRIVMAFRVWVRALPGRLASTGANVEAGVLYELARVESNRIIDELSAIALSGFEIGASAFDEDAEADSNPQRLGITAESLTTQ